MIESLLLSHYKGFARFRIDFGSGALLVGPNNAGKSTIISALRLCASAAKTARRLNPRDTFQDGSRHVWGFPLAAAAKDFVTENVRHEFRDRETRLELRYKSGAQLKVVWPRDDDGVAFFYVDDPGGPARGSAKRAKETLTEIGVVPQLAPLEQEEHVLEDKYLTEKVETRLASRHFRNHLRLLQTRDPGNYRDLVAFLLEHSEELDSLKTTESLHENKIWIDVVFTDAQSRVEKELVWSGDGLQIWLQLLFHIWRNREARVLLLDEPDVFLHPDLQRRLIRVLQANPQQTILASHAPEMASEAATGTVTWVERTLPRAKRVRGDKAFGDLSSVLGSNFNLAVARALRARVALFVEGQDMQLLRVLAKSATLDRLANEEGLAVIPIGGFSRWPGVEAFSWLKREFLGDAVEVRVLLDRDYRSDQEVKLVESQLTKAGVVAHIWRNKEIENYLLDPDAISALSGASAGLVAELLDAIASDLRTEIQGHHIAAAMRERPTGEDAATVTSKAITTFDSRWAEQRLSMLPGKRTLALLNARLQEAGFKAASARGIASRIHPGHAPELFEQLRAIEEALA